MKEKSFLNEILSPKLLAIAWGFIIMFCVFIGFSIRGKCATSSTVLPYLPNNNFNSITQNELDSVLNKILETYPDADFSKIIVFKYGEGAWWTWSEYATVPYYTVYSFSADTCLSNWNGPDLGTSYFSNFELFNSQYSIAVNLNNVTQYTYCHREIGDFIDKTVLGSGNYKSFFGDNTITHIESPISFDFNANYPVYTSFKLSTQDPRLDSGEIIATSGGNTIISGEATPPDISGDNIGNDKPDIDDYIPNIPTMPSLDNSSLEKIAESIYNILQWGFNAIKGTITGLFKYLGDLLAYSFQKVIDNIKNAIQNLYDNFKSLFEPLLNGIAELLNSISQKIDYISQPLDSEALQEAFNDTALMNDFDSISQTVDGAFTPFTSTEEPDSFKIPLHTEQIPLINNTMLTNTVQYIDLGVINPVKPYIRAVMWALTSFGMLYTIIDAIPSYLQGDDE